MIHIDSTMSDSQIRNILESYLQNNEKYEEKQFLGKHFLSIYVG